VTKGEARWAHSVLRWLPSRAVERLEGCSWHSCNSNHSTTTPWSLMESAMTAGWHVADYSEVERTHRLFDSGEGVCLHLYSSMHSDTAPWSLMELAMKARMACRSVPSESSASNRSIAPRIFRQRANCFLSRAHLISAHLLQHPLSGHLLQHTLFSNRPRKTVFSKPPTVSCPKGIVLPSRIPTTRILCPITPDSS
jgi:hypothetical protein